MGGGFNTVCSVNLPYPMVTLPMMRCVVTLFLALGVLWAHAQGMDPAWREIQEKRVLNVGLDFSLPYDTCLLSLDRKKNKLSGLEVDLVDFFASEWKAVVRWHRIAWENMWTEVSDGTIHMSVQEFYRPPEEDPSSRVTYSNGYLESGLALLHNAQEKLKGLPKFDGKRVAAFDDPWVTHYINTQGLQKKIKLYNDETRMFNHLQKGQLDYIIYDRPLLVGFLNKQKGKYAIFPHQRGYLEGSKGSYGVVIKKGNNELLREINKAIDLWIQSETVRAKVKKCGIGH